MDNVLQTFKSILEILMATPDDGGDQEKWKEDILLFSDCLFLRKYAIHNKLPEFFRFNSSDESPSENSDSEEEEDEEEDDDDIFSESKKAEKPLEEIFTELDELKKAVKLMGTEGVLWINKLLLESNVSNPYLCSLPGVPVTKGWLICRFCKFKFCPLSDIFMLDDDSSRTRPRNHLSHFFPFCCFVLFCLFIYLFIYF